MRISRDESLLATLLRPTRPGNDAEDSSVSSQASGFFWEREGKWYLVTNLHVITGWNYEKNEALATTGFTPTHIDFELLVEVESHSNQKGNMCRRISRRVSLAENDMPAWLEHPKHGHNVDVAVLPLCKNATELDLAEIGVVKIMNIPANRFDGWTEYDLAAADDAYVIGYPKGMHGAGFPIWKRASIASEPDVDVDGLPKFLVDTATREGMSGSPVVTIRRGITNPNGVFDGDTVIGESIKFAGIYSGRIGEDELGVQLGIVWKSCVIDEIIDSQCAGRFPWDEQAKVAPVGAGH